MNRDTTTIWDSAALGVCLGVCAMAAILALAGCEPAQDPPRSPGVPPMPVAASRVTVVASHEAQGAAMSMNLPPPTDLSASKLEMIALAAAEPVTNRGTVRLAWDASPDPQVTGYKVIYSESPSGPWFSAVVGNVTNATIAQLKEGFRYYFTCVSVNAQGVESVPSNEVSTVVPVNITMSQDRWRIQSFGVYGKTNSIKMSTNLSDWWTLLEWIGDGVPVAALHTNGAQAWFRVETK